MNPWHDKLKLPWKEFNHLLTEKLLDGKLTQDQIGRLVYAWKKENRTINKNMVKEVFDE